MIDFFCLLFCLSFSGSLSLSLFFFSSFLSGSLCSPDNSGQDVWVACMKGSATKNKGLEWMFSAHERIWIWA